jgi:hypothetical protein
VTTDAMTEVVQADSTERQGRQMSRVDRGTFRLSASLLAVGFVVSFVAGLLHPAREPANNHAAVFAEYAQSPSWTAVHLGQFAGLAVIIAGLLTLYVALDLRSGAPALLARLAAVAAIVAVSLYGVLQAVDGVALKQAVDALATAPDAEKPARFASAEAIRWLEWGTRSYHSYVFGLALVLFGAVIAWTARAPRPVGYLMALSGLAYLVQGWILGSEGFSANNSIPTLGGYVLVLAWTVWILIFAWRMKESAPARRPLSEP